MNQTNKCIWSDLESNELEEVCLTTPDGEEKLFVLPAHKDKLIKFYDSVKWKKNTLLVAVLMIAPLSAFSIMLPEHLIPAAMAGLLMAFGVVICLCPLCTPQTVAVMGIAKSIRTARTIGIILISAGICMLFIL